MATIDQAGNVHSEVTGQFTGHLHTEAAAAVLDDYQPTYTDGTQLNEGDRVRYHQAAGGILPPSSDWTYGVAEPLPANYRTGLYPDDQLALHGDDGRWYGLLGHVIEPAEDDDDLDEGPCRVCGGPNDDGEGSDGMCGNCADRYTCPYCGEALDPDRDRPGKRCSNCR